MSTLGLAPNLELGPSLTFFLPYSSLSWHQENLRWGKIKDKLGPDFELGTKPKFGLFSFFSIGAFLIAKKS
jgi:hypothetical protein